MRTVAIVQARMGSTRLWGKVLRSLSPYRLVIEEVLRRAQQIPGVDEVGCAIADTIEDQALERAVSGMGIWTMHGPESDVLKRYALAADRLDADIIVRITADCPLLNPQVCGDLIALRERLDAGYASNAWPARSFAHGEDCEVFTRDVLDRADHEATAPSDREHVCPWMQRQPDIKKAFLKAMEDRSHLRWTLDTDEDLEVIRGVFKQMRESA